MRVAQGQVGTTPPPLLCQGKPNSCCCRHGGSWSTEACRWSYYKSAGSQRNRHFQVPGGTHHTERPPICLHAAAQGVLLQQMLAEEQVVNKIIHLVVLEQLIARLLGRTTEWIQCHQLASLEEATHLVEDHLAVFITPGGSPVSATPVCHPSIWFVWSSQIHRHEQNTWPI